MDNQNYYGDYESEYDDSLVNKSFVNKKVCKMCEHKEVCYMYKDICEGRKWYQDYFGADVSCSYFKNNNKIPVSLGGC